MRLLKELYQISSPSGQETKMQNYLLKKCAELGAQTEMDSQGNIYVTKGISATYPCVVAHMDEVCPTRGKGYRVICQDGVLFGFNVKKKKFSGIGGDDKNGIWVALNCLAKYDTMKCAFFVQEESGCVGSSNCNLDFFNDCRFVLQCDRRGSSDLITDVCFTDLCSEEFLEQTNYEKFGYKEESGMLTDVYTLKVDGLAVSCLNISCGYYEPHSDKEYTVFSDLVNCLNFVQNIIENCTDVYPHICKETKSYGNYSGHSGYKSYGRYYSSYSDKEDMTDEEYEDYVDEYYQVEAIICGSYYSVLDTKNDDEIADDILQSYAFQYITRGDILGIIDSFR